MTASPGEISSWLLCYCSQGKKELLRDLNTGLESGFGREIFWELSSAIASSIADASKVIR